MSDKALTAFKALRGDIEQFDTHEPLPSAAGNGLFSERIPIYMKSDLANWLRKFMAEHGDEVEAALAKKLDTDQPAI